MASSKSRRFSRGRNFLYEQEVEQIFEEEGNSIKSLISSLPIADDLKLKIAKESNLVAVLKDLEEYSTGVCRIKVHSPESSQYYHVGSGFYIGDGWVLTTSNVIRNRSQLKNASFVFFSTEGTACFEARDRRAFVHRMLPPGRRPDYHNRDLTLIKLGVQFTRRRRKEDITAWENEEQAVLESHKPFSFQNLMTNKPGLSSAPDNKPHEEDMLCTVYRAMEQDQKRFQFGFKVSRVYQVLDLGMYDFSGDFEATVTGCPMLGFRNGQFYFLGVFLPGSSHKVGSGNVFAYTGQVLLWHEQLGRHLECGIKAMEKMPKIVAYTLDIPFNERAKLVMDKTVYEAAELALQHRVLIL